MDRDWTALLSTIKRALRWAGAGAQGARDRQVLDRLSGWMEGPARGGPDTAGSGETGGQVAQHRAPRKQATQA